MNLGNSVFDFFLRAALAALDEPYAHDAIQIDGKGVLASRYPVTDLACASIGAAALMLARWINPASPPPVRLDRPLASWWFAHTLKPQDWQLPAVRDAVTGDYAAADGWIRLHANAAHHRRRALRVLDLPDGAERDQVAARVRAWSATDLEAALVEQAACAAALRPPEQWRRHPQGLAVVAEPLLHRQDGTAWTGAVEHGGPVWVQGDASSAARPLAGVRVLDLTRVLAGPVCTRFLAAWGAQVLRLDPTDWEEPGMVPEVTVGKRCAELDLRDPAGLDRFRRLLAQADVLVHGYRPDALDRLGLGADVRQRLRPGLVDVSLDAWGWTGPWCARRGFDSLVQMSTGIAWPGRPDCKPDPLPVQALDQATGYWMAACVLKGLLDRRERSQGSQWRASLARTAALLTSDALADTHEKTEPPLGAVPSDAYETAVESTAWGPAHRLQAPCRVGDVPWRWDRPAGALRSSPPDWW
ncbi:MAG: CoA transferase [Castellaniella sp.]|uniref:CoA transferase n=1 Tax=Castellaniella sp. TaxID=1955812 RepID=UPI003C75864F